MPEKALSLYIELYGPYPYPELIIAQNDCIGGMEYSGLCSISGNGFRSYRGEASSSLIYLIVHEISHQWWYGAVGNDQVYEPWLDEGMAKLSEYLYYSEYYPDYLDCWKGYMIVYRNIPGYMDDSIYDYQDGTSYVFSVYGKAAEFMVLLLELMGEEDFLAFVKDYYQRYQGQLVSKRDFFETVILHTQEDLTPLLEKYFKDPTW